MKRAVNENSACKGQEVVGNKQGLFRALRKAKILGHVGSEDAMWVLARTDGFEGKIVDFGLYPKRNCKSISPFNGKEIR